VRRLAGNALLHLARGVALTALAIGVAGEVVRGMGGRR
jgi:hypothetical protein